MRREEPDTPSRATAGRRGAPDWPADLDAIERARDFLRTCTGTVAIACDNDVDGLCAAVIVERALAGGAARVQTIPLAWRVSAASLVAVCFASRRSADVLMERNLPLPASRSTSTFQITSIAPGPSSTV